MTLIPIDSLFQDLQFYRLSAGGPKPKECKMTSFQRREIRNSPQHSHFEFFLFFNIKKKNKAFQES